MHKIQNDLTFHYIDLKELDFTYSIQECYIDLKKLYRYPIVGS